MKPPPPPPPPPHDMANRPESSVPPTSYSKIIGLARPEMCMLILAFFLMVIGEATSLLNPLIVANAYDALVDSTLSMSERMSDINRIMLLVVLIHTGGTLAGFLRGAMMAAASERIVARLRNRVYTSILKQEMAFFDEHQTGELVSRLGSDTTLIQQAASSAFPEVIVGLAKLCVALVLMFWISPHLAGVTIGFVAIIGGICMPFGKLLGRLSKAYQDALGQAQTRSTEALGAMRTVQSFAAEEREARRYQSHIGEPTKWWWPDSPNQTTYRVGIFKSIVSSGLFATIFGLGFGSMYLSLWYGFKLVNDGTITLGQLTAFQSYIFQIGAGLGQTARFITQVMEARGASGRVFELLERVPAIPPPSKQQQQQQDTTTSSKEDKDGKGDVEEAVAVAEPVATPLKPESMKGAIEFDNVSFSYPSRPDFKVLKDISLTIPPNTTAALVGSSGAGKSTVVALLQRFYEVQERGSITIDGNDLRDLDLQWLRQHIGYVQQEPQLFGLTVRENICYGVDRDVTEEELESVCKEANAHEFIMKWPTKYETLVGERGVKLSGGQKQRIAIARALLVNPRILLLDEATSALDAESEHLVQEAIEKAMVGRTVVIVAHRLSTIQNAGKIVVIDDHEISDEGTHTVLLGRCEKYQQLIKRQSVQGFSAGKTSGTKEPSSGLL